MSIITRVYFNKKCVFTLYLMIGVISLLAQKVIIPIAPDNNLMLLQTDNSNRLKTIYFRKPLADES